MLRVEIKNNERIRKRLAEISDPLNRLVFFPGLLKSLAQKVR